MEHQLNITPKEDLMQQALDDYERASDAIHHWNSAIPAAIREFYSEKISAQEAINKLITAAEAQKESVNFNSYPKGFYFITIENLKIIAKELNL